MLQFWSHCAVILFGMGSIQSDANRKDEDMDVQWFCDWPRWSYD